MRIGHLSGLIYGLALLFFFCPAFSANSQLIATVLVVNGEVFAASADGTRRPLQQGDTLLPGDAIQTQQGQIQVKFIDDALMTLYENTHFHLKEYRFEQDKPTHNTAVMRLIKGLIHTLAGKIGEQTPKNYRLETKMAILGVRGTNFRMRVDKNLHVSVLEGAVQLSNDAGTLVLSAGQNSVVDNFKTLPELTPVVIQLNNSSKTQAKKKPALQPVPAGKQKKKHALPDAKSAVPQSTRQPINPNNRSRNPASSIVGRPGHFSGPAGNNFGASPVPRTLPPRLNRGRGDGPDRGRPGSAQPDGNGPGGAPGRGNPGGAGPGGRP